MKSFKRPVQLFLMVFIFVSVLSVFNLPATASIPGLMDDSLYISFKNTEVTKNYTWFYFEDPNQYIAFAYYAAPGQPWPDYLDFSVTQENQEIGIYDYYLFDSESYYEAKLKEGINRFSITDNIGYYSFHINVVYIPQTANAQRRGEIMQAVINANNQSVDEQSFLAAESGVNAQLAIPYDNYEDKISLTGMTTAMDKYFNILSTGLDSIELAVESKDSAKVYVDGVLSQTLGRAKVSIPLTLNSYLTKIEVKYETSGKNYQYCIAKLPSGLNAETYQEFHAQANTKNEQSTDQATYDQNVADMTAYVESLISDLKLINLSGIPGAKDNDQPYQVYVTDQPALQLSTFTKEPAEFIFNGTPCGALQNLWKTAALNLKDEGNTLEIRFGQETQTIFLYKIPGDTKPEIRTALVASGAQSNANVQEEADYLQAVEHLKAIYRCNREGKVRKLAAGRSHFLALLEDGTVTAWDKRGNWMDVPDTVSQVQDIGAGNDYSVALKEDGTVVAWGSFTGGTNVPAGLNNVRAISVGPLFTLALKNDGTVVQWGAGIYSRVPAGLSQVKAVSAGAYHALALKEDGTVVGWGGNDYGEISIPEGLTGIQAISAGEYVSLLKKADGTVMILNYNYQSVYPPYLRNVKEILCINTDVNYAILTDGSVKSFSQSVMYTDAFIYNVPGNGKIPLQITAHKDYYEDYLMLMADGTVFSPNSSYQQTLSSFFKKYVSLGTNEISKDYSIFYTENPNQTLKVNSNGNCQISLNGQPLKSFTNSIEAIPFELIPGKNELEISLSDEIFHMNRKITVFYLPAQTDAAFRQAVMNQVTAANAVSTNETNYHNGVNSIMNLRVFNVPELGLSIQKPYTIRLSTAAQVNLSYDMFDGSINVSVNGTPVAVDNAAHGKIPVSLNPAQNEISVNIQFATGATQTWKTCLFYLPESSAGLQQTVGEAIALADGRAVDEASYQQEVAGITAAKTLTINNVRIDPNRLFNILYTENKVLNMGVTVYNSAKVLQDFTEVQSLSRDHQSLSLNLHNGVNNLEVQFGEGAALQVYKICVFYIPANAEASFRTNTSAVVTAANQKNFDQTSFNSEIKAIIQNNKTLAFDNFIGNLDMNRQYRILYTENAQLSIKCSTAERADISMVKMSDGSNVAGSESYTIIGGTGSFTIGLVEGRNLLTVTYTEFGEVKTYRYAIFRGSSKFGRKTKGNIINAVINADNQLANNDGLTWNIKLADTTNTYFWNLNSNWFKWL
ncbi:MAG: hypothetical protein KBA53_05240 [Thermoclostridium sp.]|nr:hypothetical protein [Thermoclostridium sp.]